MDQLAVPGLVPMLGLKVAELAVVGHPCCATTADGATLDRGRDRIASLPCACAMRIAFAKSLEQHTTESRDMAEKCPHMYNLQR